MILNGYKSGFRGVLGHEFVGKVIELAGNAADVAVGQRVVGSINISVCAKNGSTCEFCMQMPHGNHCSNREVVGIYNHDGAFAQYLAIPMKNLYVVPDNMPSRVAVFTEPLAAAFRAVEQAEEWLQKSPISPPLKIAVMGDGKLGNLIVQALRTAFPTAQLHVFGRHLSKMAALCRLTYCYFWNETVTEHYSAYFHIAVEATGSPQGIQRALALVKPRGLVILKSTCSPPATGAEFTGLNTASINDLVVREISVCGSRCGPFDRALFALQHNQVQVDALVERVCPLGEEALRLATTRGVKKVLIEM